MFSLWFTDEVGSATVLLYRVFVNTVADVSEVYLLPSSRLKQTHRQIAAVYTPKTSATLPWTRVWRFNTWISIYGIYVYLHNRYPSHQSLLRQVLLALRSWEVIPATLFICLCLCTVVHNRVGQKHGFLSVDLILPAALGPGVYSASNRNEYQELIK
jgi:hypothetical protein